MAVLSGQDRDLVAALAGEWTVTRTINGGEGRFTGTAEFVADGAGGLRWSESGELAMGDHRGPARRAYRIVPAGRSWEVRFDDGRPFHRLDLAAGAAEAEHRCGPDTYRGRYALDGPDRLTVDWRVTGPGRDDAIASVYVRRARRSSPSARTSA